MRQARTPRGSIVGGCISADKLKDASGGGVGRGSPSTPGSHATDFVSEAAVGDMYEIQAAQIAMGRGSSADVREMAEMILEDHTRMASDLARLVTGVAGVAPPADLDRRRQGLIDDLLQPPGEDFDGRYVDQQIIAHQEAIALRREYVEHGENEQLKAMAADHLPVLQQHLEHARRVKQAGRRGANEG